MTPEVIDGAREPRSVRGFADPSKRNPGPKAIPEGKRIFKATHRAYRLQLTAPEDIRTADGRTIRGAKPEALKWEDNVLMLDIKKDAEKIRMLEECEQYGRDGAGSGDFWDYADDVNKRQEVREQEALKVLEDPESRARIIAALQASGEDFTLPKVKTEPAVTTTAGQGDKK